MKYYRPKQLKPNLIQFGEFVRDKVSETGRNSAAYKIVQDLFEAAGRLFNALADHTSERLSTFVDANTYLTESQERDLVALTAIYVMQLETSHIRSIVKDDPTLDEADRAVLFAALDLYHHTAEATYMALGNPRWVTK